MIETGRVWDIPVPRSKNEVVVMQVDDKLFKLTNKEIIKMKATDFKSGDTIYVTNAKSGKIKYIIELNKGEYKTFGLKTRVIDGDTFKYLTTLGSSKGFRPYYIDDFIHR